MNVLRVLVLEGLEGAMDVLTVVLGVMCAWASLGVVLV